MSIFDEMSDEEVQKHTARVFGAGAPRNHPMNYDESIEQEVDMLADPAQDSAPQAPSLRDEARARTEQANLYMTIMDQDLFAPGSARPEIQEIVENEMRDFASRRLSELLGMQSPESRAAPAALPFDAEEIEILKGFASKVKDRAAPSQKNQYVPPTPAVRQVAVSVPAAVRPVTKAPTPAPKPEIRRQPAPSPRTQATAAPAPVANKKTPTKKATKRSGVPVGRSAEVPPPVPVPSLTERTRLAALSQGEAQRAASRVFATGETAVDTDRPES